MATNFPNSHLGVVSTVTLVLKALIDAIKLEIPSAKYVYDEQLTYESSLTKFRDDNNMRKESSDFYPLFSFKRSVLAHVKDGASRRVPSGVRTRKVSDTTSDVYRAMHGNITVDFIYYTKLIDDLERFEIAYLCEEGISAAKDLKVDLTPQTGDIWTYYVDYNPLSEKTFVSDGKYYKAVTGSLDIKGFYILLRENAKHITSINLTIQTFLNEILAQDIIT